MVDNGSRSTPWYIIIYREFNSIIWKKNSPKGITYVIPCIEGG
jgi:hypothetical protein